MASGFRVRDTAAIGRGNVISVNPCPFAKREEPSRLGAVGIFIEASVELDMGRREER
jgi:hypothetical protein